MDHNRKVVELPLDDILPNRFQPRIKFNEDSIIELSESIKEHGVIQPIVVRPVGDKYEIIAGERRYKASCMAGLEKIPALITDLNDKDSAEVALIENVQRKDLTPIEEAISYKKILDMGYLTQEKLAEKLGKKQSTVANKLRLLNLDEDVQEAILEDKISERHARSILKLTNPDDQKKILKKIIEERLTVRKTDEVINDMLKGSYEETKPSVPTIEPKKEEETIEPSFSSIPFDFSKLNISENINIDVKPEQANESKEDTVSITPTTEIPKFDDLFAEFNTQTQPSEPQEESKKIEEPISNIEPDSIIYDDSELKKNISNENDELMEKPTPFVFDNLFINNSEQSDQENSDVVEITETPESIEFIDDLEEIDSEEEKKPEDIIPSHDDSANSNVRNETYVASDFKTVINTIRNCAETIEKYGFNISVNEIELNGEYKVTFDIKK